MKYRTYPNSEITVSEVGFGLWTTATDWWGKMTDAEAVKMLQEAAALGITFFDAADVYGNGRSEEQLAAAFKDRRDEIVYATKFGYDFYNNENVKRGERELPHNLDPKFLRFALDESLRRLQTDYIDIYQFHNARMEHVDNDELFELLETFKKEGKIRMYGIAFGPAIGWLYEGVDAAHKRRSATMQIIWNILEQFPGNQQIKAAYDADTDTGYQIRVPHSSGLLEGHYTEETVFPEGDHRRHRPKSWLLNGVKKVEQLRFLETPERTLGQAAIQWLLAEPRVMTVLPNIYNREQLLEFAKAPQTPQLTADELARIAQLFATNFGIGEPAPAFKGTMTREGATV